MRVPVHDDQHLREVKHPNHVTPPQPITKRIHVVNHYNPDAPKPPPSSWLKERYTATRNNNQNARLIPADVAQNLNVNLKLDPDIGGQNQDGNHNFHWAQNLNQNVRFDPVPGVQKQSQKTGFEPIPDQPVKPVMPSFGKYEPQCRRKNDIVYIKTHKTASSTIANVIHR